MSHSKGFKIEKKSKAKERVRTGIDVPEHENTTSQAMKKNPGKKTVIVDSDRGSTHYDQNIEVEYQDSRRILHVREIYSMNRASVWLMDS